jgi:hypothetical protein
MPINYSRQAAIRGFEVPNAATVVGTGAIGSWVAYFAALSGVSKLLIYAVGPVKETDIARLPFPLAMTNKPYSYAVGSLLYSVRPDIELRLFERFVPETSEIDGVVFNCAASDERDFDRRVAMKAEQMNLPYVSGGYGEDFVFAHFGYEPTATPSLEPLPVWAGIAATTGALMVEAACRRTHEPSPSHVRLNLRSKALMAAQMGVGETMGR